MKKMSQQTMQRKQNNIINNFVNKFVNFDVMNKFLKR